MERNNVMKISTKDGMQCCVIGFYLFARSDTILIVDRL